MWIICLTNRAPSMVNDMIGHFAFEYMNSFYLHLQIYIYIYTQAASAIKYVFIRMYSYDWSLFVFSKRFQLTSLGTTMRYFRHLDYKAISTRYSATSQNWADICGCIFLYLCIDWLARIANGCWWRFMFCFRAHTHIYIAYRVLCEREAYVRHLRVAVKLRLELPPHNDSMPHGG